MMGRAMCIRKRKAEHKLVRVGVAYRKSPPEDREGQRKWRLDQDQVIAKLDTRPIVVGSLALDGEGYVH